MFKFTYDNGGEFDSLSFGNAFAKAKKKGMSEFEWKGNRYHTRTKEEDKYEKGKREEPKYISKVKSDAVSKSESNYDEKNSMSQAEIDAEIKRIISEIPPEEVSNMSKDELEKETIDGLVTLGLAVTPFVLKRIPIVGTIADAAGEGWQLKRGYEKYKETGNEEDFYQSGDAGIGIKPYMKAYSFFDSDNKKTNTQKAKEFGNALGNAFIKLSSPWYMATQAGEAAGSLFDDKSVDKTIDEKEVKFFAEEGDDRDFIQRMREGFSYKKKNKGGGKFLFKHGGIIVGGVGHNQRNNIGDMGVPVVSTDSYYKGGGKYNKSSKVAEIEDKEIIFNKETAVDINRLVKEYDGCGCQGKLVALGRIVKEALKNTKDETCRTKCVYEPKLKMIK